ncbi:MAG: hypothetical protein CXZ00_16690 [Acidobacteria bacterium]|nr:MAG: hypothetical protein CXZ00_16690 [Acidobacteriota bacterium]
MLDLISSGHLTQADWEGVIYAAIIEQVPQVARAFLRIMGASAIHAALNISHQHQVGLPIDWHEELKEHTSAAAEWLRSHSDVSLSVLLTLTQDLNPL